MKEEVEEAGGELEENKLAKGSKDFCRFKVGTNKTVIRFYTNICKFLLAHTVLNARKRKGTLAVYCSLCMEHRKR